LTFATLAALVSGGAAVSQPPVPKDTVFPLDGPGRIIRDDIGRLGANDVVERIMAFDKNKDGKVTKDELPERMHDLIAKGDTNKDGALDRDEIQKLAAAQVPGRSDDVRIGGGPGPGPAPGAIGGFRAAGNGPPGAPGPLAPIVISSGPILGGVEGVVDDLKLSGQKKEDAKAAAKEHQENVRKLMQQARADLLLKMKKILSPRGVQGLPGGPEPSRWGRGEPVLRGDTG
jgi:hypothetical protein